MKIIVVSERVIKKQNYKSDAKHFFSENNFITIRDADSEHAAIKFSGTNILKLQFSDISKSEENMQNVIFFNEYHANLIKQFIESIDTQKTLIINCVAGISRSGAVGYVLNEYFNTYLERNIDDFIFFKNTNKQIMPNPLVVKILKDVLFEKPDYSKIFNGN